MEHVRGPSISMYMDKHCMPQKVGFGRNIFKSTVFLSLCMEFFLIGSNVISISCRMPSMIALLFSAISKLPSKISISFMIQFQVCSISYFQDINLHGELHLIYLQWELIWNSKHWTTGFSRGISLTCQSIVSSIGGSHLKETCKGIHISVDLNSTAKSKLLS